MTITEMINKARAMPAHKRRSYLIAAIKVQPTGKNAERLIKELESLK